MLQVMCHVCSDNALWSIWGMGIPQNRGMRDIACPKDLFTCAHAGPEERLRPYHAAFSAGAEKLNPQKLLHSGGHKIPA